MADKADKSAPEAQEPAPWLVQDSTCVSSAPIGSPVGSPPPVRTHEIIVDEEIRSFDFRYGKKTPMTEVEARKFVPTKEFLVFNPAGERVLPTVSIFAGVGKSEPLEGNQCIARFDELTIGALRDRAAPLPGGEGITEKTPKADIIAFLIRYRKRTLEANKKPEARIDEDGVADMDPRDIRRMSELEFA